MIFKICEPWEISSKTFIALNLHTSGHKGSTKQTTSNTQSHSDSPLQHYRNNREKTWWKGLAKLEPYPTDINLWTLLLVVLEVTMGLPCGTGPLYSQFHIPALFTSHTHTHTNTPPHSPRGTSPFSGASLIFLPLFTSYGPNTRTQTHAHNTHAGMHSHTDSPWGTGPFSGASLIFLPLLFTSLPDPPSSSLRLDERRRNCTSAAEICNINMSLSILSHSLLSLMFASARNTHKLFYFHMKHLFLHFCL